jgi:hypothetical protein
MRLTRQSSAELFARGSRWAWYQKTKIGADLGSLQAWMML